MASDSAKHTSFSHENSEKQICFAPSKAIIGFSDGAPEKPEPGNSKKSFAQSKKRSWQQQKQLLHTKELVSNI